MYIYLFGLIQLISSTRPKFDVWFNLRSELKLGRPIPLMKSSTLSLGLGHTLSGSLSHSFIFSNNSRFPPGRFL